MGEREREREREGGWGEGDVNGSILVKTESHNIISEYFMSSTEQKGRERER